MPSHWLHFRVSESLAQRVAAAAATERRSVSNWLALLVERALAEEQKGS